MSARKKSGFASSIGDPEPGDDGPGDVEGERNGTVFGDREPEQRKRRMDCIADLGLSIIDYPVLAALSIFSSCAVAWGSLNFATASP